jgi:glutathione S-transferase
LQFAQIIASTPIEATMSSLSTREPITVAYWSIRGLAAPLRMMVMYTGTPLNNVMYDVGDVDGAWEFSAWRSVKPELKAANPLINLPWVHCPGSDRKVTQSNACFAHIGRKTGLWGRDDEEIICCEEFLCEVMDIRNMVIPFSYSAVDKCKDTVAKFLGGLLDKNSAFAKMELVMSGKSKTDMFLVGGHATAPDFHLFEMIYQVKEIMRVFRVETDPFQAACPCLCDFYAWFSALPENKRYLESKLHTDLPINNKMAGFGASPNGLPWTRGQSYDYNKLTGIF